MKQDISRANDGSARRRDYQSPRLHCDAHNLHFAAQASRKAADWDNRMSVALAQQVHERLSSASFEMPTLPHVATKALAIAQDDNSTSKQLADLICQDQALATNILRMANTPAFAGTQAIVSLQQAITRLGMQTVSELAITICVKGSIFPKRAFKEVSRRVFSHALATALFAKEIARQQRRNTEAAYLCGLLHTIGMPIVLKAITEVQDKKNPPTDEVVRDLLRNLHVDVGLRASESWDLPRLVLVAIKNSQNFQEAQSHRHLAAVIHLASTLSDALVAGEAMEEAKNNPVLDELSIYPDQLDTILSHQERIASAVAA